MSRRKRIHGKKRHPSAFKMVGRAGLRSHLARRDAEKKNEEMRKMIAESSRTSGYLKNISSENL